MLGTVKNQEDVAHSDTRQSPLPPTQSTEEMYNETMKELQFDTALLVEENEAGNSTVNEVTRYDFRIRFLSLRIRRRCS